MIVSSSSSSGSLPGTFPEAPPPGTTAAAPPDTTAPPISSALALPLADAVTSSAEAIDDLILKITGASSVSFSL